MTFLIAFLAYILGVCSVIVSFYFYPKIKREQTVEETSIPDEKEEKLKEQWDNLLNYDGNIRE